jgi:hypothetical protein
MLRQGWFWLTMIVLFVTNIEWMKGLFVVGLVVEILVWVWGILSQMNHWFSVRAEEQRRRRQWRIDQIERDKREEAERAWKLQCEREQTKRQLALIQEVRREKEKQESGNDLLIAAQQCEALKQLIDRLPLQEDDSEALKLSIDRKLFRVLKGKIDGT